MPGFARRGSYDNGVLPTGVAPVCRRKPPAPQDAWYNQRRLHSSSNAVRSSWKSPNSRMSSGLSLARRKSGVQIPSPPPPNQQVRAPPASSGRRSLHVAAALRPREQVAVQLGRLSATRRLGPRPPTVTTERSRRLQPEPPLRWTPDSPGLEATLAQADGRAVRGYGRTARSRPPPDHVAARRTDELHELAGADTTGADTERADTDAGHRTSTPGHWTADAWTSHTRTLDGQTRHRTLLGFKGSSQHRLLLTGSTVARRGPRREFSSRGSCGVGC